MLIANMKENVLLDYNDNIVRLNKYRLCTPWMKFMLQEVKHSLILAVVMEHIAMLTFTLN